MLQLASSYPDSPRNHYKNHYIASVGHLVSRVISRKPRLNYASFHTLRHTHAQE